MTAVFEPVRLARLMWERTVSDQLVIELAGEPNDTEERTRARAGVVGSVQAHQPEPSPANTPNTNALARSTFPGSASEGSQERL